MHGLRTALRVNDDQTAMHQHRVRILIFARRVRAARHERMLHAVRGRGIVPRVALVIDKTADSTHRRFLLYSVGLPSLLCGYRTEYAKKHAENRSGGRVG